MITSTSEPTTETDQLTGIHRVMLELGQAHLLPALQQWLTQEMAFVRSAQKQARQFFEEVSQAPTSQAKVAIGKRYSQVLLSMIETRYAEPEALDFDQLFPSYRGALTEYLEEVPKTEIRLQSEMLFQSQSDTGWVTRMARYGKKNTRIISYWPTKAGNKVRQWRKREARELREWQYTLPLRGLVSFYYREKMILELLPLVEEAYRVIAGASKVVWKAQDRLYKIAHQQIITGSVEETTAFEAWEAYQADFDAEWQLLEAYSTALPEAVAEVLSSIRTQFERDYERAGTLELPARRFGSTRLKQLARQYGATFCKDTMGWRTTLFALHDDWRLDEELNLLNDTLWVTYFQWVDQLQTGLQEQVLPQAVQMAIIIQEVLERVEACPVKEMKRTLRQERKLIDQQLIRERIPATTSVIHQQAFGNALNVLRTVSEEAVDKIADQRGLVASDAYDQPLRLSDVSYVSPRQLADYEMLPRFQAVLGEIQMQTRQKVSQLQKLVQEVGQISYFNLDSAISVYEKESSTSEEAQQIAVEGLKRGLTNAERLQEQLQELADYQTPAIHTAVKEFEEQLTGLTNNHYALELKIRLARARASERTKVLQQKTIRYFRQAFPRFLKYVTQQYRESSQRIGLYRRRIGMDASTEVTTEISDFLAETQVAINRLPYVYQRLFSIKPLEDSVFYEEQPEAVAQLRKAFENWKQGRYASTILIGQKGCGITTLIRFFLDDMPRKERRTYTLLYADAEQQIYSEALFLHFFQELLTPEESFKDLDSIIHYLCTSEIRHILIIEHLEHFYLRRVGGFQCLRWLMELISRTHQQVFWLASCTQYAWDYLDKTSEVSDHFEYIEQLPTARAEVVREVILKRHRVSGYDIFFAPADSDLINKKFLKLDEPARQVYLEEEYFQDLSRITGGNFAVALLYWLRSTQEVTDDRITIGSLKKLDFTFLKSLSVPQMIILHALLLHDGLTVGQFQELAGKRKPVKEVVPAENRPDEIAPRVPANLQLMQLYDDGLLTRQEEVYHIHPLLYRQVVELLQTRNFVH